MENLLDLVNTINEKFKSESWLDFEIVSLQKGSLRIKASTDFSYYHVLEIEIFDTSFFSGPIVWGSSPDKNALIKILSESEVSSLVNTYKFDTPRFVIAFNSDENFKVIIAANRIQYNLDIVYYYARENLNLNERIDEEILRSGS